MCVLKNCFNKRRLARPMPFRGKSLHSSPYDANIHRFDVILTFAIDVTGVRLIR